MAEIIELVSDEEDRVDEQQKKNDKKSKACNANCINFKCDSGLDMRKAPSFACAYYGVNLTKKKKRMICQKCFDTAVEHQEQLVDALLKGKSILNCHFPDHTMEVEISDSDSDDEDEHSKEDGYLSDDTLKDLEKKFIIALDSIEYKCDLKSQLENAEEKLKSEWDKIDDENSKLDRELKLMMSSLDSLRNGLYDEFKPNIKLLEELNINEDDVESHQHPLVATKKVTQIRKSPATVISQQDNQPEILQEVERDNRHVALDLPPHGTLIKPLPEVDSIVYIMKHPLIPWIKSKVYNIISRNPLHCRVKLLPKKYNNSIKSVFGKQIAVAAPCSVIIPVATRVVAIFQDVYSTNYYSGVVAEPPKSTNKYRYLIFFDDGYAQYVTHKNIFVVCESSARVWEDIPKESQDFIKKYLESYPERPMVKLQTGQILKTEWNGKWWLARVIQVDASLVQMHFDADNRTEWIYRGSARLRPLYVELMKATARQQGHHALNTSTRLRVPQSNKTNLPYVEYTSLAPETEESFASKAAAAAAATSVTAITAITASTSTMAVTTTATVNKQQQPTKPIPPQQQSRAVAKKSTAKKIVVPETNYNTTTETKPSHSIVYYQTQNKIQTKKFVPHKCGPKCVEGISFTPDDLKGYSPLSIPLLCGWNRQLCKFSKGKKVILYQAPCGVRLRNMDELHRYLRVTGSAMSVDLFEFDHWVHCLAEFVLDKCFVNIRDLSYGVENVPIPCVNELDHALPDTIRYSTQREPTEGVHLNLDPEFLCSCDCEDDCQDKNKCQCWQLTVQGATLGGRVPNTAVGYVYKRLPEPVTTGIYECNSRCKCAVKTCLNRVVQHPLTLKLQVFKTAPRGWGIRCLNDIPHGSFICIYAGRLLTEQGANEGGKNYGDEYLAELDYVEVVEGIKEGYESDVVEPDALMDAEPESNQTGNLSDEEEENINTNTNDSDEDFHINEFDSHIEVDETESIRKRLRKRKKASKKDEENNELAENTNENGNTNNEKSNGNSSSSNNSNKVSEIEQVVISDDEDNSKNGGRREPSRFDPTVEPEVEIERPKFKSVRDFFGEDEAVYIMDAKTTGNIGRYLNHSCDPNVFVQNVFVDTHDVRFPWVAFFALNYIRAGQELTWNYSYDVGSIPGKVIICKCGASNCRGRLL